MNNIKCFNCGYIYNGNICPNCGAPVVPPCAPTPQIKKSTPAVLIIVITLLCFAAFSGVIIFFASTVSDNISADPETSVAHASDFQLSTGTSSEQEALILSILTECEIGLIDDIKHDELLDNVNGEGEKGYRISSRDIDNIILYLNPDKSVSMVRYADNDLYIGGSVVSILSDYTFTWSEESDLQISCRKVIESVLKSPSTAKFPNITKWTFGKEDGKIIIQSYVDSQNSFGAEIRSEFQFILSAKDYNVESLIFDGEEMIGK